MTKRFHWAKYMKRKVGRHPNIEYYQEILRLPGKQLFSPAQIAARVYDKDVDYKSFRNLFSAIYQFGVRNGLKEKPDNCEHNSDGTPVVVKGKHILLEGHRHAKWYGETWRNALYDDDLDIFKKQLVKKLATTLTHVANQKHQVTVKVVSMQRPEGSVKKPRRRWMMIALVAVAVIFSATSLYNYSTLNQGFAVLRKDGPKAAMEFFKNRGETYDTMFGRAWAAYRNGDYDQASTLGKNVLKSSKLDNKARANYLLGELSTITGDFENAQEYLLAAHGIYETTGKSGSEFRTLLALSKLFISQKDKVSAEYYLNLAATNQRAKSDHFFLYLNAQLAFLNNDFDAALELSLQREEFVGEDNSQLADVYSEIGFFSCLVGDYDTCFTYTMRSQNVSQKINSEIQLMYNNVNLYLYQKCTLRDYSYLREAILDYARKESDTKIMEYVYFVDKFSCPIPRPGAGHIDPPDDPPPDTPVNRLLEISPNLPNDGRGN